MNDRLITGNIDGDLKRFKRRMQDSGTSPWLKRGSEPGELNPAPVWPCKMRLTFKKNSNRLTLRCDCMAETVSRPSRNFHAFDPIGDFGSLNEAVAAWEKHREEK